MAWLLTPLLLAMIALNAARGIRQWEASRAVNSVRELTIEANQQGSVNRALLQRNIKLLLEAEKLSPVDVDLPIARGGQNLLLKRPRAALVAFERALSLEPRGEVYAYIGRAQYASGNYAEAYEAFQTAVLLDRALEASVSGYLKRLPLLIGLQDAATEASEEAPTDPQP
ncbi:MAG: tetratricopeptide repeat protein [Acidobacteriota bacterium]